MDEFDELLGDIGEEDSFLSEEAVTTSEKVQDAEVTPQSEPTPEPTPESIQALQDEQDGIPALVGNDYPVPFKILAERVQFQYRCLPKLNYAEIYEELGDLAIKSHPSPTLQVINDEIQKVQAAKERLSEIYRNVERNFFLKKRSVDILECAWAKYTSEKSADKRKGDAVMRVSNFVTDFALTEACYRVCQHIIKNLDSCHDSLSRQITVNQLLLKMHDYGRGGLPDYDFEDKKMENEDLDSDGDGDNVSKEELEDENF